MGHPQISAGLASSDEDADKNDTIDDQHIVSEGLNSRLEIQEGNSKSSYGYGSINDQPEECMRDSTVDKGMMVSEFPAQLGKTELPRKWRANANDSGHENIKPKQMEWFRKRYCGSSSVHHKSSSSIKDMHKDDEPEVPSKPSNSKVLKKRRKICNDHGSGSGDTELKWFEPLARDWTDPDINNNM